MDDGHMKTRAHARTGLRTEQPSRRRATLTRPPGLTRCRQSNARDGAHIGVLFVNIVVVFVIICPRMIDMHLRFLRIWDTPFVGKNVSK